MLSLNINRILVGKRRRIRFDFIGFVLILGLSIFFGYIESNAAVIVAPLFYFFIGGIFVQLTSVKEEAPFQSLRLFRWSMVIGIICGMVFMKFHYLLSGSPYPYADSHGFYKGALKAINKYSWDDFVQRFQIYYIEGYYYFLATILLFFKWAGEPHLLSLIFLNAASFGICTVLIYRICALLFSAKFGFNASILFLLYPHAWFLSGILIRDMIITMLCLFFLYFLVLSATKDLSYVLLNIFPIGALYIFRQEMVVFLLGLLFAFLFFYRYFSLRNKFSGLRKTEKMFRRVATIFILLPVIYFGIFWMNLRLYDTDTTLADQVTKLFMGGSDEFAERAANLEGQGLTVKFFGMPLLFRVPALVFLQLILPFPPWQILSATNVRAVEYFMNDIGSMYWLILLPFVFVGMIYTLTKRNKSAYIIVGYAVTFIIVMAVSSYVQMRWRMMVMPSLFVLCAIGFYKRKNYKPIIMLGYAGIISGLVFYLYLK